MKYTYLNELYHHGIKGMRWGVRKKDYKLNSNDIKKYGRRGAYRIAKRMDTHGVNRAASRRYEQDRRRFGKRGAEAIDRRMRKKNQTHQMAANTQEVIRLGKWFAVAVAAEVSLAYLVDHPEIIGKTYKVAEQFVDSYSRSHSIGKYKDIFDADWREVTPTKYELIKV